MTFIHGRMEPLRYGVRLFAYAQGEGRVEVFDIASDQILATLPFDDDQGRVQGMVMAKAIRDRLVSLSEPRLKSTDEIIALLHEQANCRPPDCDEAASLLATANYLVARLRGVWPQSGRH